MPIPSPAEREQIVQEIETRFIAVDQVASQVEANLKRAARLRQSILKRAFEGKLVPQDPSDEPASVLLERIRRQRSQTSSAKQTSAKPATRPEPNEVFTRRAAVETYIVESLSDDHGFGRTKLEKVLYLTQTHLDCALGLEFSRYQLGPLDERIYRDEKVAKKKGWYETKNRAKRGVTYHLGPNASDLLGRVGELLLERKEALDGLLAQMAKLSTDEAELLATAYAAWNDLLIDGRSADEDAIIAEIHGWHESKAKFKRKQILSRIAWMRRNGYVPTGRGQRTIVLDKTSPRHR